MENYTNLFIAFLSGVCFHAIWTYLVAVGYSVIMFKGAMRDSLLFLAKNVQTIYEINYIKEEAWRLSGRDEKYIEFQQKVDKREIESLKSTTIRNFINSVPPKHNYLIKFHDWDSAMDYIDKIIKEEK